MGFTQSNSYTCQHQSPSCGDIVPTLNRKGSCVPNIQVLKDLEHTKVERVRVCRTYHTTLQELSTSTASPSPEIDTPMIVLFIMAKSILI
ncbi:hypothetical protein SK128_013167 [Halocaridina rubra]|uniref:Uncharacterized protein n=1 Tax=Halocaridina rubra TaxID=373956 RepID=A0AAN9A0X3_HALRR